jgi:hypothetical protein
MSRVRLEVIAPIMSEVACCSHCTPFFDDAGLSQRVRQEAMAGVPERVRDESVRLSKMIGALATRHGAVLQIVLVDPRTLVGMLKAIRHWIRRYPAFIVSGRGKYVGWDLDAVERLLRGDEPAASAALQERNDSYLGPEK